MKTFPLNSMVRVTVDGETGNHAWNGGTRIGIGRVIAISTTAIRVLFYGDATRESAEWINLNSAKVWVSNFIPQT